MNFEEMNGLISQVINKENKLLIIDNAIPGMGIVNNLMQQLKDGNLLIDKDYVYNDNLYKYYASEPQWSGTNKLIEILKENNGKIIVFDDSDDILDNPSSIDILKALIDGECSVVTVNRNETFTFDGGLIFIARHLDRNTHINSLISRGTDIKIEDD